MSTYYRLGPLLPGDALVQASMGGYDTATVRLAVTDFAQQAFSPLLYPVGTTPEGANGSFLSGVVVDSVTNLPMPEVAILITGTDTSRSIASDVNGNFSGRGITDTKVVLSVDHPGYRSVAFEVLLQPLSNLNIGQIRLRPNDVEILAPDLTPISVVAAGISTDPQTLMVSGALEVTLANQGTTAVATDARLTAYLDVDHDSAYSQESDFVLGEASAPEGLAAGTTATFTIPIHGSVPFRDAPIHVAVDSLLNVVESDESNNHAATSQACRGQPAPTGTLDPVVKWHWSGSSDQPYYNQVMSTPTVAQLSDDNGDGVIDGNDTPDIIFTSFNTVYATGYLRAISGSDGSEIWSPSWPTRQVAGIYGPAVGDIDNDGLVEIIIGGPSSSGLKAFEHDGTLKWTTATTVVSYPALADLDHDGTVEIIYGNSVFDSNGTLLWKGSSYDWAASIADIDMDGRLEIFTGGKAYRHNGTVLWSASITSKWSGVANFDDDEYPEIAVVDSASKLYLLDHTGNKQWGPVTVPGGGFGPITIADLDGDGAPEIGIAGKYNYVVFETDGSIKWQIEIRDWTSYSTGSSVFDFEGDGKAEVLYGDEHFFRIFDGATGAVLFKTENPSGTAYEYPVIADIDNDGHAEIVVVANNFRFKGITGIRAFEGRQDNWMQTRSIWNQHAYHIDNINDDGSIPQYEAPSWLSHNSYRLNTFPGRDLFDQADLSVAQLLVMDNGTSQPQSLRVRVGNGGLATPLHNTSVTFFEGDPANGGRLLGTKGVIPPAVGMYIDLILDGVNLSSGEPIYAIVDPDERLEECNESNNLVMSAATSAAPLGEIQVLLDQSEYGANTLVNIATSVRNLGSLTSNYSVILTIEDRTGQVATEFAPYAVDSLQGGV